MYKLPRYVDEIKNEESVILFNRLNGLTAEIEQHLIPVYEEYSKAGKYDIKNEYLIKSFFIPYDESENIVNIANQLLKQYDKRNSLFFTIMPTEKCNFRCTYCYEDYKKGKMKETTAKAIVDYIEKIIDNYSSLHVEWFGGEPTLAIDIIQYISEKVIALCKKHRKPFTAGMTTNGYLLSPEIVERLYAYRVYTYQITIDGYKQTHDKQRMLCDGSGTFDVITENIKAIQKNFRRKFLQFIIRTNLTTEILKYSLDDYLDFAQNVIAPNGMVNFRFRVAWVGNDSSDPDLYIRSDQECYKYLFNRLKNMPQINIDDDFYELLPCGEICYAANKHALVFGSDGAIYKCTVHFEDEKNKVGIIRDDGSIYLDQKKLNIWHTRKPIEPKCYECKSIFSCLGIGCPYNCGSNSNCGTAITYQHEMIIRQHFLVSDYAVKVKSL